MNILLKTMGFVILAMVLVACGTTLDFEDGNVVVTGNISLTEQMLNTGDSPPLTFDNTELVRNAEYDIQDGVIVVTGDFKCDRGNNYADGQMTVLMEATDNGFINVEITDVESDCNLPDGIIENAQNELASGLADAARDLEESDATLTFTEVTLADDTVTIAIEFRAPMNNNQ